MKRLVETKRFGAVEVEEEHVVHFKDGMVGFSQFKDYFLIESPNVPLLLWLQSVDEPSIAFPVVEPYFFLRDYKAPMMEADKFRLGYEASHTIKTLVVMTIPSDMTQMTVNMKAPILIDLDTSMATQVILQDKHLLVRQAAHESFSKALANVSVSTSTEESSSAEWFSVNPRRTGPGADKEI